MKKIFTMISLGTLVAGSALAQSQADNQSAKQVSFVLVQSLVKSSAVNGKTKEELVPNPKAVVPGDLLLEEITVKNISGKSLTKVTATVPVPNGTEFSGNATPANDRWSLRYSIDGGKSYSEAPTRKVTVTGNSNNVTKDVPAPISTYTHVRWTVTALKLDESLKLSFRVKVK